MYFASHVHKISPKYLIEFTFSNEIIAKNVFNEVEKNVHSSLKVAFFFV